LVVRLNPEARRRVADLERIPLVLGGGPGMTPTVIPLSQLATITTGLGPARITHLDRDNVVRQANASARSIERSGRTQACRCGDSIATGYTISQGGESEQQAEVFTSILAALGLAGS
jgi:HAE1 family hydrophobic/amphiphilic exporter-1